MLSLFWRYMASLTVRQLDEALKQQLRLRAARNGRSVEDEVRTILRKRRRRWPGSLSPGPAAQSANDPAAQPAAEAAHPPHPPDHRRRHRRL